MSNLLTDWRLAVMAQLDTQLQAGSFTVHPGRRDGPSRNRKLACVFVPTMRPDSNINYARPRLIVRAWVPQPKQPKQESPQDPEPVEQLLVDLVETLQQMGNGTRVLPDVDEGRGLYFEIDEVTPDYDDWGVQVTLAAWTKNPGTIP